MIKIKHCIKSFIKAAVLLLLVFNVLILCISYKKLSCRISKDKQFTIRNTEETIILNLSKDKNNNTVTDWHDYERINKEALRKGIGEQGLAAYLTPSNLEEYDRLYEENSFNAFISDHISVERSLPDIRRKECRMKKYMKNLPIVSVIIPFYNEHWSTLLRTLYSILNRSPNELIKEIILVDDCSTKNITKKHLDEYLKINLRKTRVVRLSERRGLILAKIAGAKVATGEVLVFLDSHTEANVNWLPPLLEPIARDYKTCVCPLIDMIDGNTFRYSAQNEGARGAFDWEFNYKHLPLLPEDLEHPSELYKNPIMSGGLFAISSKFFWELGGYDPGLDVWGGEQYELSFKIWQCGGKIYDAPCSRVGHIFRRVAPYKNPRGSDFLSKNYKRVAEVWMDEYSEYIYRRKYQYRKIDPGNLTDQKNIREKLNCKPFKWFLKEIAFDLLKKYPLIDPPNFASGQISNLRYPYLCVEMLKNESLSVRKCVKKKEQNFTLTWQKDLRISTPGEFSTNKCWAVFKPFSPAPVRLSDCHEMGGNQYWHYDLYSKVLLNGKLSSMFKQDAAWSFLKFARCLDLDIRKKQLYVTKCDDSSKQKWKVEFIDFNANWEHLGLLA